MTSYNISPVTGPVEVTYKFSERKNLFLLTTYIMFLLIGISTIIEVININSVSGFLFWPDKPPKPSLITKNPIIVSEFDKLYEKYPNIRQEDVDQAHQAASIKCYTEANKNVERDNPESADSALGQLMRLSFCQGFMNGEMEDYLEQLGIQYYPNPERTGAPKLAPVNQSVSKPSENSSLHIGLIETSLGSIGFELFPESAPNHVRNFENLAKAGFYDDMVFHRIVPGFVIQTGDPNTKNDNVTRDVWGTGGPGYTINEEFNDISHKRGILSMARTDDPNSAGSQFFIVLNDSKFLDNQYTVFGNVTSGMDIVDKIANLTTNTLDQPINSEQARIHTIIVD